MNGASLMDLLASAIRGGIEPKKLFEIYIPGFTSLRIVFARWLRVDLTKVMTFGFFGLLYVTAGRTMVSQVYEYLLGYFTSTVSIAPGDRIHRDVLAWISDHISKRNTRYLSASSTPGVQSTVYSDYIAKSDKYALRSALNGARMLTPMIEPSYYRPVLGKMYFMFQYRPFIFDLRPGRYGRTDEFNPIPDGEEPILIRCLGRSTEPLKVFLDYCKKYSLDSKQSLTTIYMTEVDKYGKSLQWREVNVRPIRPLSTVDLADGVKEDILSDIEKYIHPSTQLFYARRGIPYRRGFLFHGPPGTGKTSLSLALAGHFRIDLYIISLASKNIDDDSLTHLFNELPPKCIVLLEDIDSAGIDREVQNPAGLTAPEKEKEDRRKIQKLSLSGLLNTIDGAASQEGRILIMTSNTPETLDAALIRHGRIDKQIRFGLITQADAEQLFIRMFSFHEDERVDNPLVTGTEEKHTEELKSLVVQSHEADLKVLAKNFASQIPEQKLSPAAVQGYLLDHREDAREAVTQVKEWAINCIALKEEEQKKAANDKIAALAKADEEAKGGDEASTASVKEEQRENTDEATVNDTKVNKKTENVESETKATTLESKEVKSLDDSKPTVAKESE